MKRSITDSHYMNVKFDVLVVCAIQEWIRVNIEMPMDIMVVAQRAGYSKWYFQRMFKTITGVSLGRYIRNEKLTEIAKKLKNTNESIADLAQRYGLESQQGLTKMFKREYSMPPGKYRYIAQKKNNLSN